MKNLARMGCAATWLAMVAMVAAPAAQANPANIAIVNSASAFRVADISLDPTDALHGQAVSRQGQPVAKANVILDNGREQTVATTNDQGRFRFDHVQPGSYRVRLGSQSKFLRAWKSGTAPPAANQGVMVVDDGQTVLGQYCGSAVTCGSPVSYGGVERCQRLLSNPLVIGGVIAAAIAIPVAIHNADDDDPTD